MKIKYAAAALAALSLSMSSCDDFLDTLPDNRTDLDTPEKVTKILVSAYPTVNWNLITEYYSDNTDDNSDRYQMYDRLSEEIYKWEDTRETGDDSPLTLWNTCYSAVAAANQALQAIDRLGNGEDLQAQRGEALLCRAYGHFMLSYVFCNAWTESGKDTDMGIPYSTEPETTVRPQYDRETIGKTYERIAADLEEGLPLIDDNNYDVPKYHFNRKAAHAFAARFYLYYGKYDKAIECANVVLGEDPALVLRDWGAIGKLSLNDDLQPNAYIDAAEPANLLLVTSRSWWGALQRAADGDLPLHAQRHHRQQRDVPVHRRMGTVQHHAPDAGGQLHVRAESDVPQVSHVLLRGGGSRRRFGLLQHRAVGFQHR